VTGAWCVSYTVGYNSYLQYEYYSSWLVTAVRTKNTLHTLVCEQILVSMHALHTLVCEQILVSMHAVFKKELTSMGNLYNKTVTICKNMNTVRTKVQEDDIVFRDDVDVSTNIRSRCFDECASCFSRQTHAFGPRAFAFRLGTTNHRHANNTSLTLCSKQRKENQLAVRNISDQSCVHAVCCAAISHRPIFQA
jgi:hypothetical protein